MRQDYTDHRSGEADTQPSLRSSKDEINLLDLLIVVAKHKKLVLGLPLLVGLITAAVTLFLPNVYTATSRILPPQQQSTAVAALLGQLGPLGALSGSSLGLKNPADLYVGMLQSRTIADKLVDRFELRSLYKQDTLIETRVVLEEATDIKAGKDGIISISVEDKDPKRAAAMANAYIEELDKLTQILAITEAAQRRFFFERQLKEAKNDLAAAEVELRKTQESSGLIQLEEQAKAIIGAIATLQASVVAKEVELASLRAFSTSQNPEYVRAQQQLVGLRKELADMQRKNNVKMQGEVIMPTGNIPQAGLEYVRKLRDVKYQEILFELLAKQLELAKLDEAKDAAIVQVIDQATEPDRKSKPKRALMTLLAAFLALFVALVVAFFREAREQAGRDPEQAARLAALKKYLKVR